MWYFRLGSGMIQLEVNLLLQRNGKNTSLVRNLANEKDKQAFYFKVERFHLSPSFWRKHFGSFFSINWKNGSVLDGSTEDREKTENITDIHKWKKRDVHSVWKNTKKTMVWLHMHTAIFFLLLLLSFISTRDL